MNDAAALTKDAAAIMTATVNHCSDRLDVGRLGQVGFGLQIQISQTHFGTLIFSIVSCGAVARATLVEALKTLEAVLNLLRNEEVIFSETEV